MHGREPSVWDTLAEVRRPSRRETLALVATELRGRSCIPGSYCQDKCELACWRRGLSWYFDDLRFVFPGRSLVCHSEQDHQRCAQTRTSGSVTRRQAQRGRFVKHCFVAEPNTMMDVKHSALESKTPICIELAEISFGPTRVYDVRRVAQTIGRICRQADLSVR